MSARAQAALTARHSPDDAIARETVGDGAGEQDQRQRRQELRQPDQAQIERVVGAVIDGPADRDGLDLDGEFGGQPHQHEAAKARMAQRRPASKERNLEMHRTCSLAGGLGVDQWGMARGRSRARRILFSWRCTVPAFHMALR